MKTQNLEDLQRWLIVTIVLLFVFLLVKGEGPPPQELKPRVNQLTVSQTFNFVAWELQALAHKVSLGLLAPQRFMSEEERAQFVLDFLGDVREAQRLTHVIDQAYTNPEINNPNTATEEEQLQLAELRNRMDHSAPIAEAILGEQVSTVLNDGGFGPLHQILPPVSGTFTPLPHILILSPRDHIETTYQQQLIAGLNAAQQESLERAVTDMFPDYAAYITGIGGLAVYPAMLLENGSIDWVADVIAHEWTHHYLLFRPLGLYYDQSSETRTINETTASLIGEWAGQEVILRFYAPLLERTKQLPDPLHKTEVRDDDPPSPPRFDFRAEMHHTRVMVDQMLSEGKIQEAEWYMEAQRRYFVANGYRLRKLNQAYFAFHGAYASSPGGAAGEDPIGPAVRQLWAISDSPSDFVHTIAPFTTLNEIKSILAPL